MIRNIIRIKKQTVLAILISISGIIQIGTVQAQMNPEISKSSIKIEMLFPKSKTKALILSYDDGPDADRRLVKLMNDYQLKGTFHLNSNKLGTKTYLTKEEIRDLNKGHEVSVHTANHPNLTTLSKIDIIYEVIEDRKELERLSGSIVRGMAYPFGNYNEFVIDAIKGLGIEYARTVHDTYNCSIPTDFLKWDPSIHQFGKAYFIPNDSENDRKELAGFYKLVNNFLKADSLVLLDVWGHSWENNGAGDRWKETERFYKMISENSEVYSATQIELVDYINAYKNLKISVTKNRVTNPASVNVCIKINGRSYEIAAGATIDLSE